MHGGRCVLLRGRCMAAGRFHHNRPYSFKIWQNLAKSGKIWIKMRRDAAVVHGLTRERKTKNQGLNTGSVKG